MIDAKSPISWITSVCLFDEAILKRFSHTQNFFFFSKINDGLSTDFSKFLENWTLIKHGKFWSSMRGRRRASQFRWDFVIWTDDHEDIRLHSLPVILNVEVCSNKKKSGEFHLNRDLLQFAYSTKLFKNDSRTLKISSFFQKSTTVCPLIFQNFLKIGP